ncbi:carbohydrate esterase family 9 protein [Crepidotus variabilis]|uniref:Carbohydrate esterase family 9 protein n=1 Tax=Crepidotus variabilis TaxID=179855 RepID=A0A9P6JR46_9AGAR|nr:carbohydrate esterase family 9 protein [Crepidotus variabilis]
MASKRELEEFREFLQVHDNPPKFRYITKATRRAWLISCISVWLFIYFVYANQQLWLPSGDIFKNKHHHNHPSDPTAVLKRCRALEAKVELPSDFVNRKRSDRFEEGTRPILVQNARIWTGRKNGTHVFKGDVLLDKGLIKSIGYLSGGSLVEVYGTSLRVVNADGAWVTPGIVDVHSHIGVESAPYLKGAADGNSYHGIIQPWLRSLDGLNTHDLSYPLSIAGGVTTALVLPGSANAIGGQGFVMKIRETGEKSPSSMLLEPPYQINTSFPNPNLPSRWRHIKHACGENPSRVYQGTRMDTMWELRQAYNKAKQIKEKQDSYCSRAFARDWHDLGEFPEALDWEALVDVLRGKTKVNVHCYEAVDFDGIVRLSNEFKFPIAAFHHAAEAYLVPDLLKKTYGKTPAVALFATFSRYKREAYRASEFAPRILAESGIRVTMKSDHPSAIDSRYLSYEAQQAYFYGLPENLAIASITSQPAEVLGMGHRIGYIKEGYDADIVIWDSHPLALGATPTEVFIDGIPQLERAFVVEKPSNYQRRPPVPNFDKDAENAVVYEGLPPLQPRRSEAGSTVVFQNVGTMFQQRNGVVEQIQIAQGEGSGMIVTRNGTIICSDQCANLFDIGDANTKVINLDGGSISPGFVSYGSPLGLEHIKLEPSTNDGTIIDPLSRQVPKILGDFSIIRATDGLQFASRDALLAYRVGVTSAVTAPVSTGFYGGLSVAFSTGASHKLEKGAIIQEVTAVHIALNRQNKYSVSTQFAALRRLLQDPSEGEAGVWYKKVISGEIPLVAAVDSADIMATLIILKKEIELRNGKQIRLTITGGAEAHLLAKELAEANIGVLLPSKPFPMSWEGRRILPGPPISPRTALTELIENGVSVGILSQGSWEARNLPFDVTRAAIDSGGKLKKEEAFALGSTNVQRLLGVQIDEATVDLVATKGGDILSSSSRVAAILSPVREAVFFMDNN